MQTSDSTLESVGLQQIDPTQSTAEWLRWLWDRVKDQDIYFDDFSKGRVDIFLSILGEPNAEFFLFQDRALFMYRSIFPRKSCTVHMVTWNNPPVHELITAAQFLVGRAFEVHNLHRLECSIPTYNKEAQRVITILHFKFEGQMRQNILRGGKYYDSILYSLLRPEYERIKDVITGQ